MPDNKDGDDKNKDESPRQPNPGLPDPATVISERTFTSPKGKRYRIIRTTEKDPYDPPDDASKSGA
jgi:hypothetical protein